MNGRAADSTIAGTVKDGHFSTTSDVFGGGRAPAEIGFVGTGRMGSAMAVNLAAAGFLVVPYARRAERAYELSALGLTPTMNVSDLFDCEIIVTMLTDDDAMRDVVNGHDELGIDGLVTGMPPGTIHLSMSTISPTAARETAALHAKYKQGFVCAPVFGNPEAARARELFVVAAGAATAVERCRPLLEAVGRQIFVVGEDPAAANLVKLVGNMLTAATLQTMAEAVALLRKRGMNPAEVFGILTDTMFGGRIHRIYGEKLAKESYTPGNFVMPLALKDIRLALAEADAATIPLPSISLVHDRLVAGIARGHATLDWTALGLLALEDAGLAQKAPSSIVEAPHA